MGNFAAFNRIPGINRKTPIFAIVFTDAEIGNYLRVGQKQTSALSVIDGPQLMAGFNEKQSPTIQLSWEIF